MNIKETIYRWQRANIHNCYNKKITNFKIDFDSENWNSLHNKYANKNYYYRLIEKNICKVVFYLSFTVIEEC